MELKDILEAILFTAQKPLSPPELKAVLAATAEQSGDDQGNGFKHGV